jgi:hypothetical protein
MKTVKKISLGLALASVLVMALFALAPKKAAADTTFTKADITGATYTFQDGGNISAKFSFSSSPVIFTDSKSGGSTRNYTPPDDGTFCDPKDIANQGGLDGKMKYGINISSSADLTKPKIAAQIKIDYFVGSNCNVNTAVLANITIQNPNQLAATDFQWDSDNIRSLNGASDSETFYLKDQTNGLVYDTNKNGGCNGEVILLDQANGNSGKLYYISEFSGSGDVSKTAIGKYFDSSCKLIAGPANVTIAGTAGKPAAGGSGTVTAAGDSCALDSGGFSLSWFMCPLLQAANDLVNGSSGHGGLLGMFEDQLSFNVNRDLGVVGGGGNQVQTTWSLIKNIASAILVIIMLVMVFSQAISAGPFDAYTIRKILPRLVAAVILMQLSWYIVAFVVDLVDDIGNSLFDLLYAPFGGSSQLDLGHLLSHANIGTDQAIIIDFVGLVGGVVLGLASLPTVLFLAFAAIVALFTALIVLIFRKIIIIFCLIFAPLAILAWILPGTQRYWKLWYDNFIKVLMMFPLIVGLIAAGHIFAYVVGTQGNGTFLNLIFIMVGVFGPLFILPKTYKWGGQALTMAGGAIHNVGSRLQKSSEEPIKGWTRRQAQGRFAKKYRPKGAPGSNLFNRTANSLLGGRVIPTKYRAAILTQSGDKWNEERDAEAQALLKRKGETAMKEGYEAAVLNDDKTGFARYKRDASGNILDKSGKVAYTKAGVDEDGKDIYHNLDGTLATNFNNAAKEDVATYKEADKRTLKGVAAMKQMWVDIADQSESSHERKMAIRQLTATASWPEIQGSLSRDGNKVIDTAAWADSITTSQEDYPRILRSRVDATPHIDNWAKGQLDAEKAKDPRRVWTKQEEKDFISQKRVLYSIKDQMSNEDFQTQSEGYWEEVARVANLRDSGGNLTQEAKDIQEALRERFTAIHDIGGTAPQQLLGHLVGGSVQAKVDKALGPGANVREYVNAQVPLGGQASTEAMGINWETTIPQASDLSDPDIRSQYKTALLSRTTDRSGRPIAGPAARVLAEGVAYNVADQAEREESVNVLNELKYSAAASPHDTDSYNAVIDEIHAAFDRRANEIVQRAVASGRPAAEVARIKAATDAAKAAEKAKYTKI